MTPHRPLSRASAVVLGLVAVAFLIGFYLMVVVFVLVYGAFVVLTLMSGQAILQPMVALALVGLGVVVVVLVRSVAQVSRLRPPRTGVRLPADSPVRAIVADLAARVGTRPPDDIRITEEANAGVAEELRLLGLVGGRRTLTLGRPLLEGITVAELRAIIAHELGHYAHGHTRLSALTHRGSVALTAACVAIAQAALTDSFTRMYAGIPLRVFGAYAWVYDRITLRPRRRQELAADAAAAAITSPATTAAALVAAHRTALAWADFTTRFPVPPRPSRATPGPDDRVAAFVAMLADPTYRAVLAETPLPTAPTTWADEVAAPLLAALPTPTVGALLDLLAAGTRSPAASPAAITALIGGEVVRAGAGTWTAPWVEPVLLAGTGPLIADAIADPTAVPRLRLALVESGVDIDAAVRPPEPAEPPRTSPFDATPATSVVRQVIGFVIGVVIIAVLLSLVPEEDTTPVPRPGNPLPTRDYPVLPTFSFPRVTDLPLPSLSIPLPTLELSRLFPTP